MGPWGWLKDWVRGNTLTGWLSFIGIHSAMNLLVIPGVFLAVAWGAAVVGYLITGGVCGIFFQIQRLVGQFDREIVDW